MNNELFTPEQIAQIKAIVRAMFPEIEAHMDRALSAHLAFPPIEIDGTQVQLTPMEIRFAPSQTQTTLAIGTAGTDTQGPDESARESLPS